MDDLDRPPPAPRSRDSSERTWGLFCHLSALALFLGIPFGNILGPLVVWLLKKDEMPVVADQGRESLNFQITRTRVRIAATVTMLFFVGFILLPAAALFDLVMVIVAAVKFGEGQDYRYPFAIRFIQ